MKKRLKKRLIEATVTCLYVGKIPRMPGTFGTLFAVPFAWALAHTHPYVYMAVTAVVLILASIASELHERYTEAHDPGEIVIDEVVGYLIAMCWLPLTWQSVVGAFVLFRFFDILKPYPISYIDQNVKGGFGTVLDDVAAGLVANVILQVIAFQTTWLGAQFNASF